MPKTLFLPSDLHAGRPFAPVASPSAYMRVSTTNWNLWGTDGTPAVTALLSPCR